MYGVWLAYLHLTLTHSKCQGQGHAYFNCKYVENSWKIEKYKTFLIYIWFVSYSKRQGQGHVHFSYIYIYIYIYIKSWKITMVLLPLKKTSGISFRLKYLHSTLVQSNGQCRAHFDLTWALFTESSPDCHYSYF